MTKNGSKLRLSPIRKLAQRYDMEPTHAEHVTDLALQLFDELQLLHSGDQRQREWLQAAALLHDIGWSKGQKGHHKNSMKLVLNSDLDGWTDEEKLIVANVARYHRKSHPKEAHKRYARLSPIHRESVRKLAALLRIADGLDRSHRNAVEKITCELAANTVLLHLVSRSDLSLELYGFEKKKELFREVYALDITIHDIQNRWELNSKEQ